MKHLKHLFAVLLLLCSAVASAHDFELDGVFYKITDETNKTVEVTFKGTSYNEYFGEYTGSVVIPETVEYNGAVYSVTSIGSSAFYDCTSLTSIVIPNSVTSIGESAFSHCSGLTSLAIPNSVTYIARYAFFSCDGLKTVIFEDGTEDIKVCNSKASDGVGGGAFEQLEKLQTVYIGRNVVLGTDYTYKNPESDGLFAEWYAGLYSNVKKIYIGPLVTALPKYIFEDCANVTEIISMIPAENIPELPSLLAYSGFDTEKLTLYVPQGAKEAYSESDWNNKFANIAEYVDMGDYRYGIFSDFTATLIEYNGTSGNVVVPDAISSNGASYTVKSFTKEHFRERTDIKSIVIGNNITAINDYEFYGCSNLTNVTIGTGVSAIGINAFYGCSNLTNVTIGTGVITIGNNAFYGCTGLASITIPNSVTSIGNRAFYNCTSLASITIPNSVTSIGNYVFEGCTGLESIVVENGNSVYDSRNNCNAIIETATNALFAGCKNTVIPNSVTSIRDYAFYGCTGLTSIEIPNSVTSIRYMAFYGCTGLTSVTIPNSVTSIGGYAFRGCTGLASIEIPNSVTSIGDYAFNGCTGLESITVNSKTPPTIQFYTFYGLTATLYVPYGAKATYQAANYWKNIANIEELPGEYSLAVTAAGYATLYLGFDAEIPEGVEVYYAKSVEGDLLKMEQVTDYLPANTGVIVKAKEGAYTFNETEESVAAIEGNLLKGTEKATTVKAKSNAQYYVLSKVDGVVVMYLAQLTGGNFLNNANKAYLELTLGDLGIYDDEVDSSAAGVQLGAGYRFDFGGTTGVSELKTQNGKVKTMYDLQGRKVEKPTKGIYIINGKKILVK